MEVVKKDTFDTQLDDVLDFIAEDSLNKAIEFMSELEDKLETLPYMPYKFRKSIYFEHDEIRDFIFKGYVIPYFIDKLESKIVLLGIVKYRETL